MADTAYLINYTIDANNMTAFLPTLGDVLKSINFFGLGMEVFAIMFTLVFTIMVTQRKADLGPSVTFFYLLMIIIGIGGSYLILTPIAILSFFYTKAVVDDE